MIDGEEKFADSVLPSVSVLHLSGRNKSTHIQHNWTLSNISQLVYSQPAQHATQCQETISGSSFHGQRSVIDGAERFTDNVRGRNKATFCTTGHSKVSQLP